MGTKALKSEMSSNFWRLRRSGGGRIAVLFYATSQNCKENTFSFLIANYQQIKIILQHIQKNVSQLAGKLANVFLKTAS